jgi:hypothetical protein
LDYHFTDTTPREVSAVGIKKTSPESKVCSVALSYEQVRNKGYYYLHNVYASKKRDVLKLTDEQTLLQTYHITDQIYQYHATWNGNAYHYTYHWTAPMEWQLYVAGVKLAQSLNAIYK